MWEPYRDVCKKYLRHCEIAVDPFHVIKHLTECFTRIRVGIMKQCVYDSPCYYLLKIWHKLLETDSFDLDNEPRYNSKFPQKMNYRDLYNMLLENITIAGSFILISILCGALSILKIKQVDPIEVIGGKGE